MKKEERIRRYGEAAYEKSKHQARERIKAHPEKVQARNHELNRRGGRFYEAKRAYMMRGIPHEKNLFRSMHYRKYDEYKKIIDPEGLTQLHHSWLNDGTAGYSGVALVEKDQHMHGYIDVIRILEGVITLLTEEEVKKGVAK